MTDCNVKTDAVTTHELYCLLMRSVWICSNSQHGNPAAVMCCESYIQIELCQNGVPPKGKY